MNDNPGSFCCSGTLTEFIFLPNVLFIVLCTRQPLTNPGFLYIVNEIINFVYDISAQRMIAALSKPDPQLLSSLTIDYYIPLSVRGKKDEPES